MKEGSGKKEERRHSLVEVWYLLLKKRAYTVYIHMQKQWGPIGWGGNDLKICPICYEEFCI